MSKALKIPRATKGDLWCRSGGLCERCGGDWAADPHHRKKKGMGGTRDPQVHSLTNLLALCRECHRWVEHEGAETGESYRKGWLIHGYPTHKPALIPVRYRDYPVPQMLEASGVIRDATDAELFALIPLGFGYEGGAA